MGRIKRSAIVTVTVVVGIVGFDFRSETGILIGGMRKVFAEEESATVGLPDGMKGFLGILKGKIVGMTRDSFVLQVDEVVRIWRGNKAENPQASVGKRIRYRVLDRHRAIVRAFAKLEVGDEVAAGGMHKEGDVLIAAERLIRAEELPALKAKWKEAEAKRKEEGGEEGASDLPDVMRGFAGILQGKIVEKAEDRLVLQIEKIDRTWQTNRAKNSEAGVGKNVPCRVHPRAKRIREKLGEFQVGDSVVAGAVHREGNVLMIAELLIKADEYPALRAKWDEAARKRKEQERREGE